MNIVLWKEWFGCVWELRGACTRQRTFVYLVLVLVGFSIRTDLAGVTSFIRSVALQPKLYQALLHLFHSHALRLERLTALWVRLALKIFAPYRVHNYLVFLADGIKIPKEGRKMPGVKKLHQNSEDISKPPFILGHSFQAVSLLVRWGSGAVAAVPLASRIHEGVVLNQKDKCTLLDKMVTLFLELVAEIPSRAIMVADAYYASRKVIVPLLQQGHHLVTRVRRNTVAYQPLPPNPVSHRGRPRLYGQKLHLGHLAQDTAPFTSALSPVYGETDVILQYWCLDLLWRPVGHLVRFVFVKHPTRGSLILLSTNTAFSPLEIIALYGYRFKIEAGFRQAIHVIGSYAYHFWMRAMAPITLNTGNQDISLKSHAYQQAVLRKLNAYHCYVQLGCIAQGLLQHLAVNFTSTVWKQFRSWLRTMKPDLPPSELVVAYALRGSLFHFLATAHANDILKKIILDHLDPALLPDYRMTA